jgi:hypothetical protein
VYAIAPDIQPAEKPYPEYPFPNLYWFGTDKDSITLEDEVTVEAIFKNKGGESAWQSIAISSPDITNTESYTILDSNLDYCEKYAVGYETGYNYGNTTKPLKYPLIEGAKNNWDKEFTGKVKLKIKPEKEGILRIYAKSVAYGSGVWRSAPKIFETSTKDQQNEYVYVKSIVVTNRESDETEIVINCPVNATITDQYNTIISDNGTNEIPDANMTITNETKIFYLLAELAYLTEIAAYDGGTFNFTRISSIRSDTSITKFENISITVTTKASVEIEPNVTNYTMSIDYDGDGEIDEEKSPDVNETIIVTPPEENIFDTGAPANPYPSIFGTHNGTITPNQTITVHKLYTYPCPGTGGHTEYAEIRNSTWNATAIWNGYVGDWHNITFDKTVVLLANETYNYTIRTSSYPQIHHTDALPTENGWINCTGFIDANGKGYNNWVPAIRVW